MNLNFFLFFILPQCVLSAQQQLSLKHIFILAGQSNMAGRGGIIIINHTTRIWDGIVPPGSRPNPSVFRLDASLQWVQAAEPLHAGIDTRKNGGANGVGPGMAFANALLAHYPPGGFGPIGLVPCAMGGTSIRQWEKGTSLYTRMVSRVRTAVAGSGEVSALLWYQGESDTVVGSDAESYGRRLVKLFGDIRMDLMSPMLPIIQVGLASGEGRFVEKVREAQFGIDMLNLRTVDAKGLALRSDKLHLTTESQVRLGNMMANAFLQFLATTHVSLNTSIHTSHSSPSITTFSPLIIGVLFTIHIIIMLENWAFFFSFYNLLTNNVL